MGVALCFLPVLQVIGMIAHELGHALVAWGVGYPVYEINFGIGRAMFQTRIGKTAVNWRITPLAGYVLFLPGSSRWRSLAVLTGGAAANGLCGLAVAVILFVAPPPSEIVCVDATLFVLLSGISVGGALVPAYLPKAITGFPNERNDGMKIRDLLRKGPSTLRPVFTLEYAEAKEDVVEIPFLSQTNSASGHNPHAPPTGSVDTSAPPTASNGN
jgi:hypothetical protein